MKRLAILLVAAIATFPAWAQQKEEAMGNTKVNTDFTKYKTFTWAKSDPHMAGPDGYEIYYYEISPERTHDKDLDRTEDMDRNRDLDREDQTQRDQAQTQRDQTQTQRDQGYNQRDTTDQTRTTDEEREGSDRMTDKTYTDPDKDKKDKSTDQNQSYNKDKEQTDDMDKTRRTDTYQNENKPSGYVYSYTMIIPARDAATNETIKEGISNELEGRGFREGGEGSDLIVSYQVLDQRAQLHGYNNDSPEIAGGKEVRQASDTATFILEPGTLMVSLIDAKTSQMVWHGWSSGLIENRSFLSDEAELNEAVHKIFEEFKHEAEKADKAPAKKY